MDLECTEVASHQGPGEAEAWRRLRALHEMQRTSAFRGTLVGNGLACLDGL